ncbi:MAG TPA: addiction module protein [Ilumatobacter sp.]|nr:addiction module protein [Ilumatobacter sp.]
MGVTAADLLEQVMALPDGERNDLVAELIARYPAPDDAPEVDSPEWVVEIERRARRVLAGESTADDWEVAEARILARLADE